MQKLIFVELSSKFCLFWISFCCELRNQLILQLTHLQLVPVLGGEFLTSQACFGLLESKPNRRAAFSNIAGFGIRSRLAIVTAGSVTTQLHTGFAAVGTKSALKSAKSSLGIEFMGSSSPLVPYHLHSVATDGQIKVEYLVGRLDLLIFFFHNWST